MSSESRSENIELGTACDITRRDFVGGSLMGTGAALLGAVAPLARALQTDGLAPGPAPGAIGAEWSGPGGVGDYAHANGNTHEVVNAAHRVRFGEFSTMTEGIHDTGETFDLVVVGGGFSGFGATYAFKQASPNRGTCLLIENHPIYGGEAKQNEFLVDGHQLYAPQGSNSFVVNTAQPAFPQAWRDFGLPTEFEFGELTGTARDIRFAPDSFAPMMKWPERSSVGYFYNTGGRRQWVMNAQANGFRDAPISERLKRDLNAALSNAIHLNKTEIDPWLDNMTYRDLLVKQLKLDPKILESYIDPYFGCASFGVSGDVISAYGAYKLQMPGTLGGVAEPQRAAYASRDFYGFPGGNTVILRHCLKKIMPEAIEGEASHEDIAYGATRWDQLDRPGTSIRLRVNSTVVRVEHDGQPDKATHIYVSYLRSGKLERVRARAVVVATGGWIARRILADIPEDIASAYSNFFHAPMLVVNVALRNWRFMERLGISAARWFDGFGWFANIRRPMRIGNRVQPLDPAKPAVLSMYVPFVHYRGRSLAEQTVLARQELLSTNYRDYEIAIRRQLTTLFGAHGFDAARDIGGIVLNRWGHAYIAPQPGFYFGRNGLPTAREIVARGYGRVSFGHSELTGFQSWSNGVTQGAEASRKLLSQALG